VTDLMEARRASLGGKSAAMAGRAEPAPPANNGAAESSGAPARKTAKRAAAMSAPAADEAPPAKVRARK
jgi:hypothetical protein